MKQYRIVCDDNENQCGPEFVTPEQVEFAWRTYTDGHDEAHGHVVQVRDVSEWVPAADVALGVTR